METKDWEKTLLQVIPGRKGAKSASTASRGEDVVCGDDRDAESEGDDNQLESPQVLVQGVLVTSTASETVGREE